MYNQVNIGHIKNYFKKPSVLLLSILTFVSIVIPYFAMIPLFNIVFDLADLIGTIDADAFGHGISGIDINMFETSSIVSTIFSSIFSIAVSSLPAVAWLIIYLNSKKDNGKAPNAGFTILFILSIIGIVSASLVLIYSFILFIVSMAIIGMSENSVEQFVGSIFLLASAVVLIAGVLSLIYNIMAVKFYSGVKKSSKCTNMVVTGKAFGVFSIIYAVMSIFTILLVFIMIMALASLIEEVVEDPYILQSFLTSFSGELILIGLVLAVSIILSAVVYILQGKIAMGYAKMAAAVPVVPEIPNYMNNNYNMYNGGYGYPQQAPANINYNNYQNTYQQPQYNQDYTPNPQPVQTYNQQTQVEEFNPEENPYQQ